MELLLCEKTLAVLQAASCCATLPCLSTANHLLAKARAGEASQQDATGAVGQTDICLRQILKPPNLNLAQNLHPLGPALCKAHGSQALELCQNTCATPHPARTPAVHRRPGLGCAGCKCISSSLGSSVSLLLFPPRIGAHVRPYHTQRIQWLNAEDLGAVLYIPPKR